MSCVINPTRPRKGSFVVSKVGVREPVLELLDLVRPFPALKALDMDAVIQQVVSHI